ncbi:TrmB family transcriptional regulator [Candidatus Woesearchaeota archaeon]|jgi:HTH-type transcriptional regulator, sugar sensing transcriptional regulator|nr:TrmB family transcriptional regulator [Candidatus Woesearchaeota archaeon]MBT6518898.1 TrmB family transcriptional regulator [Candidatus Woesearchaeota archaeon]MBT7368500.1 TrmB family transcriptional regulator [Candidatus Woesearchaeota archaeon]
MDTEILTELGFTQREIKVYLALIELGTTTVGPITAKSKLQSAKVYETLEKLKDKGLVSHIIVSKTKHFQAADPKEILNIIDERKKRFNELLLELELKQKYAQSKQIAIVHEGYKSFKALFNKIISELGEKDSYWAFAFKNEYQTTAASLFLRKFHSQLGEKKIDDRLLGHISVRKDIKKSFKGNKNIKIRFTKNETPLGVIIIKNKVINLVWSERPTAIEITSEQIYEQYKNFFLELWENAKK